jgi:hypothetical protein
MKRLLYLFSFYILFLSGVPCSPNDGCCQDHHSSNNQKSDFPCSPFFPCGACHGVVIPNHTIQVVQPLPPIAKQTSLYTQRPLLAFTAVIWQPPKRV